MRNLALTGLSVLALGALAACSQDGPRGDPLKGGEPPPRTGGPMRPDGLPEGHPPMLPEGHPPMDGPTQMAPPVGAKMMAPSAAALAWTVPEGWKETPPSSAMRMTQFDLPGTWSDGGAVQCVLFTAMGGGKQGNLDRWVGQVGGATEPAKVTESARDGMTITRIEIRGSFSDGMTKPPRTSDDALLLGAVVEVPGTDGVYTVKLAGPRSVIEPETAKFDALLASLKTK